MEKLDGQQRLNGTMNDLGKTRRNFFGFQFFGVIRVSLKSP